MTKHIFITGGVVSSLGKGITAASIAMLLKQRGLNVKIQKLDPYLNVDPGTMSPYQHGEVYVTEDGAETDLDLGHYERFADIQCSKGSNYTTGRIYSSVISREREGGYLGGTVQVIPHITDEIKKAILSLDSDDVDVVITELGGTAGDIESLPFLEAIRQFRHEYGFENALSIHLTLVPYIRAAGEMKTKPSQQSVGILREIGIIPEILVCRCERSLEEEHRNKLSLFCNVKKEYVIEEKDVENSIYEVPLELVKEKLDEHLLTLLKIPNTKLDISEWSNMVKTVISPQNGKVKIAVIGKYIRLQDAYKSIYEALVHGGIANSVEVEIKMIEAEDLEKTSAKEYLSEVDGILVPGGFGDRGVLGKTLAVQYARENKIPFLGICLGMQCVVIEFAKNVCNLDDANSSEFNPNTKNPVIDLMDEQRNITAKGGTMRLGAYPCKLKSNTNAFLAYNETETIKERHRHRYEFNPKFTDVLTKAGLVISGTSPDGKLVEIVELKEHPWFVACQFHPEFKSTPLKSHPLFNNLVKATLKNAKLAKK